MEKPLKCFAFAPPSLLDISLRRVVILLWSDPDILDTISKFPFHELQFQETREEWQKTTEDKIKLKIWKLLPELPENLPPMMIPIVPHISSEIKNWAVFHDNLAFVSDIFITLKLCWTAEGAIDYRKTAAEFAHNRELNVKQRYRIASCYCLEDDIPLLWGELSAEEKRYFSDSVPELPFYWPAILKGEEPYIRNGFGSRTSFNQFAFESEAEFGTKAAAEYFFRKLTNEERGDSLIKSALSVLTKLEFGGIQFRRLRDIVFYLLSIMTPEQQLKIIKESPVEVWLCFLVWPRQHLFLENAGLFWTFIDESRYDQLLLQLGSRCKGFYFPKLFAGFLKLSPLEFKKYFFLHNSFTCPCRFLSIFFRYEDADAITEMFSSMDRADRVKLVLNNRVFDLFLENMRKQVRWDMVKLCLQEATLSKKGRKRLRKAFARFLARKKVSEECLDNFKKFFKFLGEPDNENKI